MGQLHELLAVEGDLRNKAELVRQEATKTFSSKIDHFDGLIKAYTPMTEDGEKIPTERKLTSTNVSEKLHYIQDALVEAIDAQLSKEETNASGKAVAELKIGEKSFGTFAATSLLALEQFFNKYRETLRSIPTLDPTRSWKKDPDRSANTYFSEKETVYRTIKDRTKFVKAEATDKHPAQVDIIEINKQVGRYETEYESGRLTVMQKADMLNRVDSLLVAIKQARAIANQALVSPRTDGGKFFDYLNANIV
jgi:hypothetical protein